jgi:hypothetical protein
MQYTMIQAAKAAGLSKSTVTRAVKSGRLSATQNELGVMVIDAAELHRVYPPVTQRNGADEEPPGAAGRIWTGAHQVDPALEALLRERSERIAELSARLEEQDATIRAERTVTAETIHDLRARLDAEQAERRELTLTLRMIGAPAKRRWWRLWRP